MSIHHVMFYCNDERGHFTGRVEIVEIADEVRLVCQRARPPVIRFTLGDVQIGRRKYTCGARGYRVGNFFWDFASMRTGEARLLVRELLANGWSVEEHAEDGPFADLVRKATP